MKFVVLLFKPIVDVTVFLVRVIAMTLVFDHHYDGGVT